MALVHSAANKRNLGLTEPESLCSTLKTRLVFPKAGFRWLQSAERSRPPRWCQVTSLPSESSGGGGRGCGTGNSHGDRTGSRRLREDVTDRLARCSSNPHFLFLFFCVVFGWNSWRHQTTYKPLSSRKYRIVDWTVPKEIKVSSTAPPPWTLST